MGHHYVVPTRRRSRACARSWAGSPLVKKVAVTKEVEVGFPQERQASVILLGLPLSPSATKTSWV